MDPFRSHLADNFPAPTLYQCDWPHLNDDYRERVYQIYEQAFQENFNLKSNSTYPIIANSPQPNENNNTAMFSKKLDEFYFQILQISSAISFPIYPCEDKIQNIVKYYNFCVSIYNIRLRDRNLNKDKLNVDKKMAVIDKSSMSHEERLFKKIEIIRNSLCVGKNRSDDLINDIKSCFDNLKIATNSLI